MQRGCVAAGAREHAEKREHARAPGDRSIIFGLHDEAAVVDELERALARLPCCFTSEAPFVLGRGLR